VWPHLEKQSCSSRSIIPFFASRRRSAFVCRATFGKVSNTVLFQTFVFKPFGWPPSACPVRTEPRMKPRI
jgi:hypothetical protein